MVVGATVVVVGRGSVVAVGSADAETNAPGRVMAVNPIPPAMARRRVRSPLECSVVFGFDGCVSIA